MTKTILRYLLIFFLCTMTQVSSAQYASMIEEAATWKVYARFQAPASQGGQLFEQYFDFYISGDSMMDGKQYHLLHGTKLSTTFDIHTENVGHDVLMGFIREDTTGKVFFRYAKRAYYSQPGFDTVHLSERLLYDFALKKGDEITYRDSTNYDSNQQVVINKYRVDSVDTVVVSAQFRKRMVLSHELHSHTITWIEGVGNLAGLLHDLSSGFFQHQLMCYTNSIVEWRNSGVNNCAFVGIDDEPLNDPYLVYPNPFNDVIHLKLKPGKYLVKVFNITGNLLFSQLVEGESTLELEQLKKGFYLVHVYENNELRVAHKLIKEY